MPAPAALNRGLGGRTWALVHATVLFAAGACAAPQKPPVYRNLIVVMVDTLRSDHLPSYGYERNTAPFLTALADEGIQLQGYATSSWTKESVASLLTGLAPQRHQAISRSDHLPPELPYLPELLRGAGFVTACFIGNLNVGRKWGFDRGFTHYAQTRPAGKARAAEVNAAALRLQEHLSPPFFLYLHYVDPHDPYRPSRTFTGRGRPYVQPRRLLERGAIGEEDLRRLVDQYDGEIRELDRALEELFAALEREELLADTLVVVTSDHGEEFGEHGGLTHGRTLFEEVLRVPLLLWSRSGLPAFRSQRLFSHLDVLPTLLEALGQQVPASLEGESQWRRLLADDEVRRPPALFSHLDLDRRAALAVLDSEAKLVHRPVPNLGTLLFDLSTDPDEQAPLPVSSGEARNLLGLLVRHHNREGELAAQRRTGTVDGELRRALAALGYLQLDTPEEDLRYRALPARLDPVRGLSSPP